VQAELRWRHYRRVYRGSVLELPPRWTQEIGVSFVMASKRAIMRVLAAITSCLNPFYMSKVQNDLPQQIYTMLLEAYPRGLSAAHLQKTCFLYKEAVPLFMETVFGTFAHRSNAGFRFNNLNEITIDQTIQQLLILGCAPNWFCGRTDEQVYAMFVVARIANADIYHDRFIKEYFSSHQATFLSVLKKFRSLTTQEFDEHSEETVTDLVCIAEYESMTFLEIFAMSGVDLPITARPFKAAEDQTAYREQAESLLRAVPEDGALSINELLLVAHALSGEEAYALNGKRHIISPNLAMHYKTIMCSSGFDAATINGYFTHLFLEKADDRCPIHGKCVTFLQDPIGWYSTDIADGDCEMCKTIVMEKISEQRNELYDPEFEEMQHYQQELDDPEYRLRSERRMEQIPRLTRPEYSDARRKPLVFMRWYIATSLPHKLALVTGGGYPFGKDRIQADYEAYQFELN
jgi:hypothetical protein